MSSLSDHTTPLRCPTCGQPAEIVSDFSSPEGTSYYRGLASTRIGQLEHMLRSTQEAHGHMVNAVRLQDEEIAELRDILELLVDLVDTFGDPRLDPPMFNATMARAYRVLGRDEWKERRSRAAALRRSGGG